MFGKMLLPNCCWGLAFVFVFLPRSCQLCVKGWSWRLLNKRQGFILVFRLSPISTMNFQVNLKRNEKPAHCRTPVRKHLWPPGLISSSEFRIYSIPDKTLVKPPWVCLSQCPSWSSLPEGINIWNMWNRSHCGLPGFGCRDPRWHVHVFIPGTFPGVETEIEFCDWKMVQRCLTSRTRCLHRSLQRTKVTTTVFVEPSSFSVSNLDGENGCRQGGKAKISSHIVLTFSSLHQWKHRKFGQKVWTAPSNIYMYI